MNDKNNDEEINMLIAAEISATPLPGTLRQGLRQRLSERLDDSRRRHAGLLTVHGRDGVWSELKAGVQSKILRDGAGGSSVLIHLTPGATLPVHRHRHLEEGIVLTGSMQMGELDLGVADYHVSAPGSRHASITSRDGCLTYLRGTSLGNTMGLVIELLGGLVPGAGEAPVTITGKDGQWQPIAEGVEEKRLWRDGQQASRFIRFAPGCSLAGHRHEQDEETMVIEGEIFFGDLLARSHEFHFAPAGTHHETLFSDTGALIFVHEGVSPAA